jgi:hypothetical protein
MLFFPALFQTLSLPRFLKIYILMLNEAKMRSHNKLLNSRINIEREFVCLTIQQNESKRREQKKAIME